jgi:hypothetical protein
VKNWYATRHEIGLQLKEFIAKDKPEKYPELEREIILTWGCTERTPRGMLPLFNRVFDEETRSIKKINPNLP